MKVQNYLCTKCDTLRDPFNALLRGANIGNTRFASLVLETFVSNKEIREFLFTDRDAGSAKSFISL
jgi:hypothetical protein